MPGTVTPRPDATLSVATEETWISPMTSRLSEDRSLDAAWDPASKADEEGCNAPPCAAPPAPAALATTPGPAAERPVSGRESLPDVPRLHRCASPPGSPRPRFG